MYKIHNWKWYQNVFQFKREKYGQAQPRKQKNVSLNICFNVNGNGIAIIMYVEIK